MFRLTLSLLAAFFLSGCFVVDEIKKGNELIEQHSSGWRKEKAAREKKAKEEAENATPATELPFESWDDVKKKAQAWWQDALAEEAVAAKPTDTVISCQIGNRVIFLRKSDCELRGGRPKATRSQPERVPPSS